MTNKLSVVLATFNEEHNLAACLDSVREIASEIVIVDGTSSDKTVEIAKQYGAKVLIRPNYPIFHINKQIALESARYDWILQLDADERVSQELRSEVAQVIQMSSQQIAKYQQHLPSKRLFLRNQQLLEARDGQIGSASGGYVAFFLPRLNFFLGKYLRYGGVYPDGAIRLVRKGKAEFPCKDVHEIMTIHGQVGWLENPLYHIDSPTFSRYLSRNQRYINLIEAELRRDNTPKTFTTFGYYCLYKPIHWFLLTQIRHKGILDGWQGVVFSFFSALRFPRAYIQYLRHD